MSLPDVGLHPIGVPCCTVPPVPPRFDGVYVLRRQTTAERVEACDDITSKYIRDVGSQVLCGPMEGLAQTSCYEHRVKDTPASTNMKSLMTELCSLPGLLECGPAGAMFIRFDEEYPSFLRAVLIGVEGTPYASGAFTFDLYIPEDYPTSPPLVTHVTPGADQVKANNGPGGFSPNLHRSSGLVCLSLLGTWEGAGWDPKTGSIYQILSSILWGILGAIHPYYMEPGHGGWEGEAPPADGPHSDEVIWYTEEVRKGTMQYAILGQMRSPPKGFEEILDAHFRCKRRLILETIESWKTKVKSKSDKGMKKATEAACEELKKEFLRTMTAREAKEDVEVARAGLSFVEEKMSFLRTKVSAAGSEAETKVPKACARLALGPGVLAAAQERLSQALGKLNMFSNGKEVGKTSALV